MPTRGLQAETLAAHLAPERLCKTAVKYHVTEGNLTVALNGFPGPGRSGS